MSNRPILNRKATAAGYAQRLQRVADYIWDHLDDAMDLAELAGIACFSPHHFHRIYRNTVGETVAETLVRLRLQRAARRLAWSDQPIAVIAREAGYSSTAAFSRAFRASYGRPPSAFRRDEPATPPAAASHAGAMVMKVEIQDRAALRLASIPHQGPPQTVGRAFDKLMAWAGPRGFTLPPQVGVALWLGDMMTTPLDEQRAIAGLTVGPEVQADDTVSIYEVPGGRHAVVLYKGPFVHVARGYEVLFSWLPGSGEEPADRPIFEVNLNDPRRTAPDDLLTEICLPLK
jgi:AraC family transcriptional regulator